MAKRRVLSLVIDLKDQASKKLKNIAKATAAFVAAGLAISLRFAKQSIDAFTVQEDALNAINAALMANNQLSEEGLKLITDRASEIQQITKAGDEAIISAVSTLSLLANELDASQLAAAEEAMVGIAATFFKGDLASAALMMGKSIGTSLNALSRYGFVIDTTGTQQEKLNEIMAQSDAFFKVAAERAKTLSGRMTQAGNAFGDFKEKVGELLQEKTALKSFFFELTNIASDMATVLDGSTDDIKLAFELVGQVAGQAFMGAFLSVLSKGFRLLVPKFLEKWIGEEWAALSEQGFENASEAIDLLHALADRVRANLPKPEGSSGGGGGGGGGLGVVSNRPRQFGGGTVGLGIGNIFDQGPQAGGLLGGRSPFEFGFSPSEGDLSIWGRFQKFVGDTGDAMGELVQNQETMAEVTGGILLNAIQDFGDAWSDAVQGAIEGSVSLGAAFQSAMMGAIAAVAKGLGDLYVARAVAAFAAHDFSGGAQFMAAAGLMYTLAGAASAAVPSGGGGGGGAGSIAGDTAGTAGGEGVVVIQGGLLDMSDPRQANALSRALSNLTGRRITIVEG